MAKTWVVMAAAAALLGGCSSTPVAPSWVQEGRSATGAKTLQVAPTPVECAGPRCPALGARWSEDKPGQAVLTVGLPQQKAEVTGVDFHLGAAGVVRLRVRSHTPLEPSAMPTAAFDVPLRLIAQLAYTPRSWLRVHTADGLQVDETLDSGDARARAAEALGHFLTAVQTAGGKGAEADAPRGGLFERLGIEEKKAQ